MNTYEGGGVIFVKFLVQVILIYFRIKIVHLFGSDLHIQRFVDWIFLD